MIFLRILFLLGSIVIGYQLGVGYKHPILGIVIGGLVSLFIILLERGLRRVSVRGLSSGVFGALLGLLMAKLLIDTVSLFPIEPEVLSSMRVILIIIFFYLGLIMGLKGRDEFSIVVPYIRFRRQDVQEDKLLLDTSAIIDGRIVDVSKSGFLEGRLIIPRFILRELHQLSDSSDPIKRQRGKRGLEILHAIQTDTALDLRIQEEDFPTEKDVDAKLVKLAKILEAKIMTVDFNLNRVASLQGIKVLNLNELANSLKPVILPGEELEVKLIKEGKEYLQAVGYLEDGTMVVVEEAKSLIGQTLRVKVNSVLQTQAGRMIFARVANYHQGRLRR